MSLHLIYIIAVFPCLYTGNGLRIARDTQDIPTHKFKPIRLDDYDDWMIHETRPQRSSSSVHGLSKDNEETHFEGEVHVRGFGPNSGYEGIESGAQSAWATASARSSSGYFGGSDDVILKQDSRDIKTQPSFVDEETNPSPIFSGTRRWDLDPSHTQSDEDDIISLEHFKDQDQLDIPFWDRKEDELVPIRHLVDDEEEDIIPVRHSARNQLINSGRSNPSSFDSPRTHVTERQFRGDQMLTAEQFRLQKLRMNPNHVLFSKPF